MGQGLSLEMIPLATLPQPLAVFDPRFCSPGPVTLRMVEKVFSLSGDDFSIKDMYGRAFFKIDRTYFSWRQKKTLLDLYGNPIWSMKHGFMRYTVNDPQGNQVCTVQKTSFFGRMAVQCTVTNRSTGQRLTITMKGDFFARQAGIFIGDKDHGICIAKLSHPITMTNTFSSRDEYFVEIAPGVDSSFIVLMCLVFDEICHEDKN